MSLIFLLFFLSGFCGLLYQVVWVRLAYASFGVITPVLSVVVSVFMLGLALGSFLGGKYVEPASRRLRTTPIAFYAAVELLIGVSAFAVPALFALGERYLLPLGEMNSTSYLLYSAATLSLAILPWCVLMGATFPLMMAFLRGFDPGYKTSFSYLYLANVVGAMSGALITAVALIELLGFRGTLLLAACINGMLALVSAGLGAKFRYAMMARPGKDAVVSALRYHADDKGMLLLVLFLTGFVSMGMEVIWVRAFAIFLGTLTYSFASLLSVYLLATWIGSYLYRWDLREGKVRSLGRLMTLLAVFAFLPIVMNDPRLGVGVPTVLLSIFPLCATLGYLTPSLIDAYSAGRPSLAGRGYALNIVGCILGPLAACYWLLPWLGSRGSLILMGAPFVLLAVHLSRQPRYRGEWSTLPALAALYLLASALFINVGYADQFKALPGSEVRRDHTATVVSAGDGLQKGLMVNGQTITMMSPITKMMAHLPLGFLDKEPRSALVICFGMGTTYRSLMSWGLESTAVELVPSVKDAFGFYFDDADELLSDPKGRVVIDDGRRFLNRTEARFDAITIDPPPPAETAGSSLLYSKEFCELLRGRLSEGGVLQHWVPPCEPRILQAVAQTLADTFPHVRAFTSIEGWGVHFLAAAHPLAIPEVERMIARMPEAARADALEWSQDRTLEDLIADSLSREIPMADLLPDDPRTVITDDRPFNEYYFLRRTWERVKRALQGD